MTTPIQTKTMIELHEWLHDHGWKCDQVQSSGITLWRWPVNDHIIDLPAQTTLRKAIALAFLVADIMHTYPEQNRLQKTYAQI